MNNCPSCQRRFSDDVQFCLFDGIQLISNSADVQTIIIPSPVITRPSLAKRERMVAGLILPIVLAAVATGAVVLWFASATTDRGTTKSAEPRQATTNIEASQSDLEAQREILRIEREKLEIEKQRQQLSMSQVQAINSTSGNSVDRTSIAKPTAATWFVILGTYGRNESSKADQRLRQVRAHGIDASIVDTDQYSGLRGGLIAIVVGPLAKAEARSRLLGIKSVVPGAYVKSGW